MSKERRELEHMLDDDPSAVSPAEVRQAKKMFLITKRMFAATIIIGVLTAFCLMATVLGWTDDALGYFMIEGTVPSSEDKYNREFSEVEKLYNGGFFFEAYAKLEMMEEKGLTDKQLCTVLYMKVAINAKKKRWAMLDVNRERLESMKCTEIDRFHMDDLLDFLREDH